ncbi:hypothetical protein MN116_002440 [Schistosoma mekongi]|uniref:TIP41-like protein n=1 Tax=Schistosoma mekongi TaxID=38744 RepID=A0AAE1ZL80_SCHME|nr:hypothetical protein MN116_002440 [Schistosoma mekongi]
MEETFVKSSLHRLGDWLIILKEHHILKSLGKEREAFEKSLELPAIPEMIFDQNSLSICFCQSNNKDEGLDKEPTCKIVFNALDALKLVDPKNITIEVPFAKDWRESRANNEEDLVAHRPYDWTFTTPYTGTLSGLWDVSPTSEGLDMDYLRRKDPIHFFVNTTLYEDELGDNGVSILNIKFRAMSSGFFLLQRFFLRVDGGLLRVYDTRLQWRQNDSYLIRDVRRMESSSWRSDMFGASLETADQLCDIIVEHCTEKLVPSCINSS